MMSDPEPQDATPLGLAELTGRQLGGYHILRRLGRGAMSEVYLAEQVSLRRHVALKILRANLAVQENYVKRFQLEAQAAAALVHPHIVQIYEVGCIDGLHFIAQEYVQGLNLHELLVRRGTPEPKLAVTILRQAASALAKAAERGIVHRDIKPENIMLSAVGEVKVADFGLARLSTNETRLTQDGFTLGTPLYMSPEQVEGKTLDARSDIYSLGVTAYHMLAGQPPFCGDSALNIAVQHLRGHAEPLESIRSDLPVELCRVVHKMFARNPHDRYASPRELIDALRVVPLGDPQRDDLLDITTSDFAPMLDSRTAVTQHLEVLMQSGGRASERSARLLIGVTAALAFLLGLGLAWRMRPALLVDVPVPHGVETVRHGS